MVLALPALWLNKHHTEDINDILNLKDHVVVGPIAFMILTIFKEDKKMETCPA